MKTTSKLFIPDTKIPEIPEIPIMQVDLSNLKGLSVEPDKYIITNLTINKDGSISCEGKIYDKDLLNAINNRTPIGCSVRYDYDDEIL